MGGRGRVKRQQVAADDGWTVITHGLSNLSVGSKAKGKGRKDNVHQAGSMPTDTVEGLTAERLLQDFSNRTERWKASACAQHLEGALEKREWNVAEAVKLFAQEPAFTPLDHAFLALLDISVCESDISTHIWPRTFVFSPFVDWYILLPLFLQDRNPNFYVGNEILDDYGAFAQSKDKKNKLEECNKLGKMFLETREMLKLKEFEGHAHALNGMAVYWVREAETEEAEDTEIEEVEDRIEKEDLETETNGASTEKRRD
ncbi:hypothetical protein N0V94_005387 [Neodidymelliopsis sp. IMI 364377]|nr:hypothetical protein N0V94_005387 [Neodidymelliopsis sp. IMI 364377]